MSDFPNRIREVRIAQGLSQQRLADLAGTSKMSISGLERGTMALSHHWMQRLARALCVPVTELLPPSDAAPALTADERLWLAKLRLANAEQRRQLLAIAEVLVPGRRGGRNMPKADDEI